MLQLMLSDIGKEERLCSVEDGRTCTQSILGEQKYTEGEVLIFTINSQNKVLGLVFEYFKTQVVCIANLPEKNLFE